MFESTLHHLILQKVKAFDFDLSNQHQGDFILRLSANISTIVSLFKSIYGSKPRYDYWQEVLIDTLFEACNARPEHLKLLDALKAKEKNAWFLSHHIVGMSLYVDRFCNNLNQLVNKLDYFEELGVNFLHLMPLMSSPANESDGGYAVSDFRAVDARFGTITDVHELRKKMQAKDMFLMLDIVLNHTSKEHEWAKKASSGDTMFQSYYYMYDDRTIPDAFEQTMPDVFPDSSPGSFTFDPGSNKWVMTVFNHYQWDLNYTNPEVFVAMIENIFFYANIGVDVLRIDAPAFIWKKIGTTCQNLDEAHTLLQLIKHCVQTATPGMALLGEAIVAPKEIMKYFGQRAMEGRECDVAYNATQMALQWDALASGDVRVMFAAQEEISRKPLGCTWINYTRCHDDIGLGFEDASIHAAGFDPYHHRSFLKQYYIGQFDGSMSRGALFGYNPKNNDARISGSLASLCGLEYALEKKNAAFFTLAIDKILLMQAQSILLGGIPMLFYGDEIGYCNDYSYQNDASKSYDNRWMHRPMIDWNKNEKRKKQKTVERRIFDGTKKLISIRTENKCFSDYKNVSWLQTHNKHIVGFVRSFESQAIFCFFNYSNSSQAISWYVCRQYGLSQDTTLVDLWTDTEMTVGFDHQFLTLQAYQFVVLIQKT